MLANESYGLCVTNCGGITCGDRWWLLVRSQSERANKDHSRLWRLWSLCVHLPRYYLHPSPIRPYCVYPCSATLEFIFTKQKWSRFWLASVEGFSPIVVHKTNCGWRFGSVIGAWGNQNSGGGATRCCALRTTRRHSWNPYRCSIIPSVPSEATHCRGESNCKSNWDDSCCNSSTTSYRCWCQPQTYSKHVSFIHPRYCSTFPFQYVNCEMPDTGSGICWFSTCNFMGIGDKFQASAVCEWAEDSFFYNPNGQGCDFRWVPWTQHKIVFLCLEF